MSVTDFYRAFEDRHRGSRELILERLQVYLPYISPLLQLHSPAKALDLGCGRGEWLQICQAVGFEVHGVDLDAGMLQACQDRGLPVTLGDGISYLQSQADASLSVVSGFHVAEHIPFEQLDLLVREALRALKPGGLLILETPNPENLVVGTVSFYLDPTHQRPIPPQLLEFLPSHRGFARIQTLRLQEAQGIQTRQDISLQDVLHGVSPDYAVVSQKAAQPDLMVKFDGAFASDHGTTLDSLAQRFDQRQTGLMAAHHDTRELLVATRQELNHVKSEGLDSQTELQALQSGLAQLQKHVEEMGHGFAALQAEHQRLHLESDALGKERDALRDERDALRNSLSWKVTAPLRGVGSFAASPVSFTLQQVLKHPRLSERINGVVSRFPGLHARLRGNAIAQGLMQEPALNPGSAAPDTLADLSPRARSIHTSLQQEIARLKV